MHLKSQQHSAYPDPALGKGKRRWAQVAPAAGAGLLVWDQQLPLLLSPSCIFLWFLWTGFSLSLLSSRRDPSQTDSNQMCLPVRFLPLTLSVGYSCVDGNCSVLLFLPLFQHFSENSVISLVFPCAISAWGTVFLPALTLTNQIVLK